MKILLLTTCYPRKVAPNQGIFIHRQALALKALGVDVQVIQPSIWFPPFGLHRFHPYWKAGYEERIGMLDELDGIPIHHPPMVTRLPSRWFSRNKWELMGKVTGKFIKGNRNLRDADWLYAQFLCHEGYAGTIASKISGVRLSAMARGDDVHAWPEKNPTLFENIQVVFDHAQVLVATSKQLAKDTMGCVKRNTQPVHTIYNGLELDRFKPLKDQAPRLKQQRHFGLPEGQRFLLCVATPVVLKGWLELLNAVRDLGETFSGWTLLMVAPPRDSPDALDLEKEAMARGIANRTKFLGAILPADMPALFQAVDGFVLPSYNEGLSNAVLEALASGLPTITTDVGGHAEFIKNSENGMLIEPRNSEQLSSAIKKLITDKDFRESISSKARASVENIGTYQENAQRLLNLLSASESLPSN